MPTGQRIYKDRTLQRYGMYRKPTPRRDCKMLSIKFVLPLGLTKNYNHLICYLCLSKAHKNSNLLSLSGYEDVGTLLSRDNFLYLTQKQSIQAQVASESAHELDEIQRAIAAESQSSRGSASIGNGGASVVGGAPGGVRRHFLAVCCFRRSRGASFAAVGTILQLKQKLFNQLQSCI